MVMAATSLNAGTSLRQVHVEQAWRLLESDPRAMLVDVRTSQEWQMIGVPDVSALNRQVVCVEWLTLPEGAQNPHFGMDVAAACPDKDAPLLFLCKAGGRSQAAAQAMAALGYGDCVNIRGGMEGDSSGAVGWIAAGYAVTEWRRK